MAVERAVPLGASNRLLLIGGGDPSASDGNNGDLYAKRDATKPCETLWQKFSGIWVMSTTCPPAYAEIYVAGGSTAQSIPAGGGYTKLTGFTTNGESTRVTADVANDKLTTPALPATARYRVSFACSFQGPVGLSVTWRARINSNGVGIDKIAWSDRTSLSDVTSVHCEGLLDIPAAADVYVEINHDNGSAQNFTMVDANLDIDRLDTF